MHEGVLAGAALGPACSFLIFEEFGYSARHGAEADRLHYQIHNSIEGLVLGHLWVRGQERVEAEPKREDDEQNG